MGYDCSISLNPKRLLAMKNLTAIARAFFCIGIAGIGVLQFYYKGFRPVMVPLWPSWLPGMLTCAYILSTIFILFSLFILLNRKAKDCALLLGGIFLLFLVVAQIPYMLIVYPYPWHLGSWTDPLKVLALSGSAFVVAGSYSSRVTRDNAMMKVLAAIIPYGKVFFGIMLLLFGIDHFLYVQFVSTLVPDWIGNIVFWSDLAGVALIGTGLSIILNIKRRLVCMLAGIMLFIWVIVLHIPRSIGHPEIADKANEMTSVFEAILFSGVAFLIAIENDNRRNRR